MNIGATIFFIFSMLSMPTDPGLLFQQEEKLVKEQITKVEKEIEGEKLLRKQQQQQHRSDLLKLAEQQQVLEEQIQAKESALRLLREQKLNRKQSSSQQIDLSGILHNWQDLLDQQNFMIKNEHFFLSDGQETSGEVILIGSIAAIAKGDPPVALTSSKDVLRVFENSALKLATPRIHPITLGQDEQKGPRSFLEYLQQGGFLVWPLLGLGVITLLILLERSFFFFKNRKTTFLEINQRQRFNRTLNLITTASPLLGLLGTVIGIMKAFDILALDSNRQSPQIMSQAISEALITTELGLIVALLALAVHHCCKIMESGHEHR